VNIICFVYLVTLTHACNTAWAQNCYDNSSSSDGHIVGLTEFGKNVVREMNRLGILVDLSHVSPQTMHDALDVSCHIKKILCFIC
jgi:membrane dipeptidase